jgi:hypothetical protein
VKDAHEKESYSRCHPERSEGSDRGAVILSEAKDLFPLGRRSFVAALQDVD